MTFVEIADKYNLFPAFVGAISAITVVTIKDIAIPFFQKRNEYRDTMRSLSERYSLPVASTAIQLFYRLREMIVHKRYDFLLNSKRKNTFNKYKYNSTVYRLASLIGWMYAIKIEHSNLSQVDKVNNTKISDIFSRFESALADGPHAEKEILLKLCSLWSIELPSDDNSVQSIANQLDQVRNCVFSCEEEMINPKLSSIKEIADTISRLAGKKPPSENIIKETKVDAIEILTPKQKWIYRDWQSAIGETMTTNAEGGVRRFDVIGYANFEELIGKNKWVIRLEELFEDLDFESAKNDYRVEQFHKILISIAELVIEINNLQLNAKPVPKKTIDHVKEFLKTHRQTLSPSPAAGGIPKRKPGPH